MGEIIAAGVVGAMALFVGVRTFVDIKRGRRHHF